MFNYFKRMYQKTIFFIYKFHKINVCAKVHILKLEQHALLFASALL